jgi:hypothetical protein
MHFLTAISSSDIAVVDLKEKVFKTMLDEYVKGSKELGVGETVELKP